MLKRAWRARSLLADANAVQLTRHPDGIAKGVAQLSELGGVIPGTGTVAHLFVVGAEAGERRVLRRQIAERAEVQARIAGRRGVDRMRALATEVAAQRQAGGIEQPTGAERTESQLMGFHPSLGHRLDRLAALGATVVIDDLSPRAGPLARVLLVVVGGPFLLLFFVIMIGICIAVTGVALALYMLFFVGPVLALDGVSALTCRNGWGLGRHGSYGLRARGSSLRRGWWPPGRVGALWALGCEPRAPSSRPSVPSRRRARLTVRRRSMLCRLRGDPALRDTRLHRGARR